MDCRYHQQDDSPSLHNQILGLQPPYFFERETPYHSQVFPGRSHDLLRLSTWQTTPRHADKDDRSYQASASKSRKTKFIRCAVLSLLHSTSDESSSFFNTTMERLKRSKIAHWSNKLAVESEPNLTSAQLMLFNHDLKPVRKDLLSTSKLFF